MNKNILERANLRQICSFILYQEETVAQTESHEEQISKVRKLAYDILENVSNGKLEVEEAKEDLSNVFDTYEEVYAELGMKLGARILYELLCRDTNSKLKNSSE